MSIGPIGSRIEERNRGLRVDYTIVEARSPKQYGHDSSFYVIWIPFRVEVGFVGLLCEFFSGYCKWNCKDSRRALLNIGVWSFRV